MKKLLLLVAVVGLVFQIFACAAITKKGTLCKRAPSPGSQYCWQHGGTTKAQRASGMTEADVAKTRCKAITKAGTQCKRQADAGKLFCWQHAGVTSVKKTTEDVALKPVTNATTDATAATTPVGQCDALTKKGTRCTRKAQPGTTKCWQHQ